MKKLAGVFIFFFLAIAAAGVGFFIHSNKSERAESNAEYILAVNEIEQLCAAGDTDSAMKSAQSLKASLQNSESEKRTDYSPLLISGICLVFLVGISGYCFMVIIRPFHKLTDFADRIAQGELDIPLERGRTDYFGKFTWAFDNMRREIIKARACEKEAIENNKTVIASLSHDLKTPVASIRAYAEGLEAGMDVSPEKRAQYLGVIMRKCDEVSKITDDMLLHSLADMDKLKITPERFELCGALAEIIRDISAERGDITLHCPAYFINVFADKGRTAQIIENLINNARKYAKSDIIVTAARNGGFAEITVRDFGKGIPDEDMPFICDKFYRGHNCAEENGSGLGLYIVKYITSQSGGDMTLKNLPDGLEVKITLPIAE